MTDSAEHSAATAATVAHAFAQTAASFPDQTAIRTLDGSVSLTWGELGQRASRLAGGLRELGLGHGDRLAMVLGSRPEFHLCDIAAMLCGATPFSIYLTSSPEQIAALLGDAEARIVITEQAFLSNVLAARAELPGLEHVIVVDGEPPDGVLALDEVDGAFDLDAALSAIGPDDLVTLIYTSGTTGPPKGVELSHANIMAAVAAVREVIDFPPASRVISWLPNAHIAERTAHLYIPIVYAAEIHTCPDPRQIVAALAQVRPHWFFAVPRVWEKLKAGLEAMLQGLPAEQREQAQGALAAATQRVRLQQAGEAVPDELEAAVVAADARLFAPIRAQIGLDQALAINTGAAPTPVPVLEFFHALGLPVAELWGMSETCGAGAINRPGRIRIGTVGEPSPGCEARLAADGELLVRGPFVFAHYRNAPEKTAAAFDADGWLQTGDVAEIDDDGCIRLIDRKKELIINAAGKNMSPANIEAEIKSASPLIGSAVCIGDGRPYNTALIVLDPDFAPAWAAQQGLSGRTLEQLATEPLIEQAVEQAIGVANARLSRVEQIKRTVIVPGDWQPGGDELTPTMKLRRKPIAEKYAGEIEQLYG